MGTSKQLPISVIIPSYNHEFFIAEAIESVLDQTQKPQEIVVIDDVSADKSRKILKNYSSHIKVIYHDRNMGGAETLNTGIRNSHSDYIAILNSDDSWVLDKLEKQFHFMAENSLDASFSQAQIIDSNSKVLTSPPSIFSVFNLSKPIGGSFLNHFFYRGNFLCHPSLLVKRKMYSQTGLYQSGLEQLPDFAKWIDFAKVGKIRILPEPLTNYRYLPGLNASSQKIEQNQIRTRNELYLIFSTFFDGVSRENIEKFFAERLSNLTGAQKELALYDPATALLLSHPEGSLATQALFAGVLRLWKQDDLGLITGMELLRSLLGQMEINLKPNSRAIPSGSGAGKSRKHRLSRQYLSRIKNAQ